MPADRIRLQSGYRDGEVQDIFVLQWADVACDFFDCGACMRRWSGAKQFRTGSRRRQHIRCRGWLDQHRVHRAPQFGCEFNLAHAPAHDLAALGRDRPLSIKDMSMSNRISQAGNALLVVVLLLLLVSVMTLFALNVGLFEQRSSGNDLRAKLVTEVAEAGLAEGMEYLRQNADDILDTGKWVACLDNDTTFPCGAIQPNSQVQTVDAGGNPITVTVTRRSTMRYWNGGGYDFDNDGSVSGWEAKMLPFNHAITNTGNGFPARYGVGPVLCRVAYKENEADPTVCTDDPAKMSPTSVLTFVSVGSLPDEG